MSIFRILFFCLILSFNFVYGVETPTANLRNINSINKPSLFHKFKNKVKSINFSKEKRKWSWAAITSFVMIMASILAAFLAGVLFVYTFLPSLLITTILWSAFGVYLFSFVFSIWGMYQCGLKNMKGIHFAGLSGFIFVFVLMLILAFAGITFIGWVFIFTIFLITVILILKSNIKKIKKANII